MQSIAPATDLAPHGRCRYDLSQLSDNEVLSGTRRLVGASNQLFAELLAHLAEVEARGIHRAKACASLYTYCIYELRFSEDAAFRRATAARFVKAFPELFDAIASGELHLTGLLMLAPHLTTANLQDVLARAKHRTKKELAKLVRELDPLPDVPARIEPLRPEPVQRSPLRTPTWSEYAASMVPVRHLQPGERPREWVDEPTIAKAFEQSAHRSSRWASASASASASSDSAPERMTEAVFAEPAPARVVGRDAASAEPAPARVVGRDAASAEPAPARVTEGVFTDSAPAGVTESEGAAPARVAGGDAAFADWAPARVAQREAGFADSAPAGVTEAVAGAQRFAVQFGASQQYVDLVERAKALLSHSAGGASLEALHLRAMRCLVTELEKKRCGAPRQEQQAAVVEEALPHDASHSAQLAVPEDESHSAQLAASKDEGHSAPLAVLQDDGHSAELAMRNEMHSTSLAAREDEKHSKHEACAGDATEREHDGAGADTRQILGRESGARALGNDTNAYGAPGRIEVVVDLEAALETTTHESSRHVPARIRRRVFERDGARCTFVDESGRRCCELEWLELHHIKPFARGGRHHAENLTLRCRAHNALAAEQDFGREAIRKKRDATLHEALRFQLR